MAVLKTFGFVCPTDTCVFIFSRTTLTRKVTKKIKNNVKMLDNIILLVFLICIDLGLIARNPKHARNLSHSNTPIVSVLTSICFVNCTNF